MCSYKYGLLFFVQENSISLGYDLVTGKLIPGRRMHFQRNWNSTEFVICISPPNGNWIGAKKINFVKEIYLHYRPSSWQIVVLLHENDRTLIWNQMESNVLIRNRMWRPARPSVKPIEFDDHVWLNEQVAKFDSWWYFVTSVNWVI